MQAAIDGSAEVGFTILSMTLSLTAVFIPLLFLGGVVGRLFREFSVVIATAILVSGVVSLTFTPMLASRFLRAQKSEKHNRFYNGIERAWDWLLGQYTWTLDWTMGHRLLTMGFSLLVLVGTALLFKILPTGFIPDEDIGQINITTEAAQGTSYGDMVRRQLMIAGIVHNDTSVASYMSTVGGGGSSGTNTGRVIVILKPLGHRPPIQAVVNELRREAGARARGHGVSVDPAGDSDRRTPVEEPIPVHDAGLRRRVDVRGGAEAHRRRETLAASRRRDERHAEQQPAGEHHDRPHTGRRLRRDSRSNRKRALRRVRLAAGVDDSHAEQRVRGDHRAAAAVPAGSVGAGAVVREEHRPARWCR